jgi:hypothetical protein
MLPRTFGRGEEVPPLVPKIERPSAPPLLFRAASWLVVLALTVPWAIWILGSPMMRLSGIWSLPKIEPEDRFQYFTDLVVAHGEHVRDATCVLCSVTVNGNVQLATTLWGDVTIGEGGFVGQIEVQGGRVEALAGSGLGSEVSAIGGPVIIDPSVTAYRNLMRGSPGYFYPGQRSWPVEGIALFTIVVLFAAACGGWLVPESFRERVEVAVRRPVRSSGLGILLGLLPLALLALGGFLFYIFPPIGALLFFAAPTVYWLILVIGLAVLAELVGSRLGIANPPVARMAGAALLVATMLVPVAGFFIMLAVILTAAGAGTGILFWRRLPSAWRAAR